LIHTIPLLLPLGGAIRGLAPANAVTRSERSEIDSLLFGRRRHAQFRHCREERVRQLMTFLPFRKETRMKKWKTGKEYLKSVWQLLSNESGRQKTTPPLGHFFLVDSPGLNRTSAEDRFEKISWSAHLYKCMPSSVYVHR